MWQGGNLPGEMPHRGKWEIRFKVRTNNGVTGRQQPVCTRRSAEGYQAGSRAGGQVATAEGCRYFYFILFRMVDQVSVMRKLSSM